MFPSWLLPCLLLLSPVLCKTKLTKAQAPTTPDPPLAAYNATLQDQELDLPPPSLLRSLYDTTVSVLETPWTDSEAASRQGGMGGMGGMGAGMRLTVTAFLASLATILGVVGFGSVGLLAAKALAVGTLALFLTAIGALKKHHSDSGGQTVHYVPIQHGHHHDVYHERSDLLPPYLDRNV